MGKIYDTTLVPPLTFYLFSVAPSIHISLKTLTLSMAIFWPQSSALSNSPIRHTCNSVEQSTFVSTSVRELSVATVKLVTDAASVRCPTPTRINFTKLICQRSSKSTTKAIWIQRSWLRLKKVWDNWNLPIKSSTETVEKMCSKASTTQSLKI